MRRLIIALTILLAVLLLGASLSPTSSSDTNFQGAWYAKDATDGSCRFFRITQERRSAGRVFSIRGTDSSLSELCQGTWRIQGLGVLDQESRLVTTSVWWCMPEAADLRYFEPDSLVYDSATDTISGSEGTVYHRQRLLIR
jgi:hypothetical protein